MNSGPTLSIGATGHDVRRLQRIFVMTKTLAPSNITGTFDVTTEQAVKDFQQGAGLTVDGIVGPATWQALPADPNTLVLARGASGSVVTALQQGLKKYSTPATDPGPVDGDFGPKTEAAVKATNRIGRFTWMGSSAIRHGGLPRAPRVQLSPRFPDLQRCDLGGRAMAAVIRFASQQLPLRSTAHPRGLTGHVAQPIRSIRQRLQRDRTTAATGCDDLM